MKYLTKIFNLKSKIFFTVIISLMVTSYFIPTSIFARDPAPEGVKYYPQVFLPALESQDVNLQSTVFEIFLSILSSMNKTVFHCDDVCQAAIGATQPLQPPANQIVNSRPTGLIPDLLAYNSSVMSHQAVSSSNYVAYIGDRLNIASPAYAQGIGYSGLQPVLNVWRAFRNTAYLLATLGFLILSFMIMFRIKISPQSVVNVQSAITKLIIVIITITFSYAIAGLVIDLLFVLSYLVVALFAANGLIGNGDVSTLASRLFSGNILSSVGSLSAFTESAGATINQLAEQIINLYLNGFLQQFFSWTAGTIGALVIGVAVIYSLFRLLIQLLFAYLEIILLTVLSPILILPDILPGGSAFSSWLRRLFANAMVFPTTTFILLLGLVIVGQRVPNNAFGITPQATDFTEGFQLPFLAFPPDAMFQLVGIGFILLLPKANDMVKDTLKVGSFKYMSAIGQAVSAGTATVGALSSPVTKPVGAAVGEFGRQTADWGLRRAYHRTQGTAVGEFIETWQNRMNNKRK